MIWLIIAIKKFVSISEILGIFLYKQHGGNFAHNKMPCSNALVGIKLDHMQ